LDKEEFKTLLIVANESGTPGSIDIHFAQALKVLFDESKFKQVFVFGETQTATANNILKHYENTIVVTPKMRVRLSIEEILEAFGSIVESLRKKGVDNEEIMRMLDNAKFHARMGWKDQLLQELAHLLELKQEIQSEESK
jgi:hypothetical protein